MKNRTRAWCIAAATTIAAASPSAFAQDPLGAGPLGAVPVSDATLQGVRGTFLPSDFTSSPGDMTIIGDTVARSDARVFGSIGTVMMTNWWSDYGAGLIAAGAASRPR